MSRRAAIIGAGSYGVTWAWLAANAGHSVVLRTARESVADQLGRDRRSPSAAVELPASVEVTTKLERAMACETILLAVPPRAGRSVLRQMAPLVRPSHRIAHSAKGLDDLGASLSSAIEQETCCIQTGVVGGPLVLEALWREEETACLVASRFQGVVDDFTDLLTSPRVRVYGSLDLVGVELAGAMRTSVALASGMLFGVGLGRSTRSVLLTRAVVEGARLAQALGGAAESLSGLNGIGDWMVAAADPENDVVKAGIRLASGQPADHDEAESRALALAALGKRHRIEMPIVNSTARILQGEPVESVLAELMARASRAEWEGV